MAPLRASRNPLRLSLLLATTVALHAQQSTPSLNDYVGTYTDAPHHTLEIVDGDTLFAVQDDAEYALRPSAPDQFTTGIGQTITFPRDTSGKVTGYIQTGAFHPRLSTTITPESAALAYPRPAGQADYHYHPPADLHDGIPVGDIADSDLSTDIANTIVHSILDGTYKRVHSILLYQHGKLILEEYFYGYSAGRTQQLRSATKTVVSTLAGLAIDRHALTGVDQRVLPLLSYTAYDHPDPRKQSLTLDNFLAMSSGLDCNDHISTSPGRETVIDDQPDWVKATLDLPMINAPGTQAYYCSGGVAVIGRAIENATHTPLPDFAQTNLFAPLGIPRATWTWNFDLTNADKEYSQIHLRPRDMLKLGILFADHGRWHGQQILSESWTRTATAEHSHVDNTSYGYFWWRPWLNVETPTGTQHVELIAAQGNGGQKIYLVPQYDLVAVFTAGGYNAESNPPNAIMAKIILPRLIKKFGK